MQGRLVSVLTPTFQAEAFLAETIESVLAQTYAPIEHVLVDDASTDGTAAILDDYARRYPERVRIVRHNARAGPCRRRNDALDAARGAFLAWLDHDDVWLPDKVRRQVEALERDPGAAVSFTQYEEFDHETGATTWRSRLDGGGDMFHRLFVQGPFVGSSTALIRRDSMQRRGLRFRDRDFSFGDDYFLWLALLIDERAVLVDEVLARLRRHDANESARVGRRTNYERRAVDVLDELLREFPEARERLGAVRQRGFARHWAAAAEWELTRGSRVRAGAYALRAASLDPRGAAAYAAARVRRAPAGLRRRLATR